jgi:DNA primase
MEGAEGFQARVQKGLTLSQFWLQGLQERLTVPLNVKEGRQQLVAMAQSYILMAQGLYQYLLVEAVAEAVGLPTWRLEKQMGIRTGFAQTKPNPFLTNPTPPAQQVMSLPKHLVCILLVRPTWAGAVAQFLMPALQQSQRRDDRMLLGVVEQLVQTYDAEQAVRWMNQAGFAEEYAFIQPRTLPTDDASLKLMLEETAVRLLDELEKASLVQKSHNLDALAALQALMKKNNF